MNRSLRYRQHKSLKKLRDRCYHLEKEIVSVKQNSQVVEEVSVPKVEIGACGVNKTEANSFIHRKSSEIRKLMPKNLKHAVEVLRHIFDQYQKSPRKNAVMSKMWPEHERKLGQYMYLLGKYRGQKKDSQIQSIVAKIKWQYKSLRRACKNTDMTWSQFHKYTTERKKVLRTPSKKAFGRKLDSQDVESIRKFFVSEEASFPLPDRKYAGKRFMRGSMARIRTMYNLLHSTTRKISLSTLLQI